MVTEKTQTEDKRTMPIKDVPVGTWFQDPHGNTFIKIDPVLRGKFHFCSVNLATGDLTHLVRSSTDDPTDWGEEIVAALMKPDEYCPKVEWSKRYDSTKAMEEGAKAFESLYPDIVVCRWSDHPSRVFRLKAQVTLTMHGRIKREFGGD